MVKFLTDESWKYLKSEQDGEDMMRYQEISRDEEVTNAKKRVRVGWADGGPELLLKLETDTLIGGSAVWQPDKYRESKHRRM